MQLALPSADAAPVARAARSKCATKLAGMPWVALHAVRAAGVPGGPGQARLRSHALASMGRPGGEGGGWGAYRATAATGSLSPTCGAPVLLGEAPNSWKATGGLGIAAGWDRPDLLNMQLPYHLAGRACAFGAPGPTAAGGVQGAACP